MVFRTLLITLFASLFLEAKSLQALQAKAQAAIKVFTAEVKGAQGFLDKTAGYLVFPEVIKGGFVIGGEYGEGVLYVKGKAVGYYRMYSGSIGFQAGLQKRSMIIAFSTPATLESFRVSSRWEAGVDGSIVVVDWGKGKDLSTISFEKPVYAFVFDAKGLMYNLTLEGTKIEPLPTQRR